MWVQRLPVSTPLSAFLPLSDMSFIKVAVALSRKLTLALKMNALDMLIYTANLSTLKFISENIQGKQKYLRTVIRIAPFPKVTVGYLKFRKENTQNDCVVWLLLPALNKPLKISLNN